MSHYFANQKVAIFKLLLLLVILSPYISSWLPLVGGMPVGPIVRQMMFGFVFLVAIFLSSSFKQMRAQGILGLYLLYLLNCIFTVISFIYGPSTVVQYAVGVSSFIFYPSVFLFAILVIGLPESSKAKNLLSHFDNFFVVMFILAALVAIVDVALNGKLVEILGYNPNYGGEDFSLITSYNDIVRANAGISDALAFGYLMAVGVIYFFNRSHYAYSLINFLGISFCSIACMLSLTRGAIISMALTIVIYMLNFRRFIILLLISPIFAYVIYTSAYADVFFGRFTDSDAASESSSLLRIVMALNSIDFLSENPMGVGIGTQGAGNVLSDTDNRLNTDNYFFHIFLELGVFFAPFFLFYLYNQFKFAFLYIRSGRFVISYTLLFIISSALSSSIAYATLGVTYWFVLYLMVLQSWSRYEV